MVQIHICYELFTFNMLFTHPLKQSMLATSATWCMYNM